MPTDLTELRKLALSEAIRSRGDHDNTEHLEQRAHAFFRFLTHSHDQEIAMNLTDAAAAIQAAADSITTSAGGLATATTAIQALVASQGDTTVLDAPVAALGTAAQGLSDAVAALNAALPQPAPAA